MNLFLNGEESPIVVGVAVDESALDQASLANDIPGGARGGYGIVRAGDSEEWATFVYDSAGSVTFINNSTNVANADIPDNLCLFANGGGDGVEVKNRLNATKNIFLIFWGI